LVRSVDDMRARITESAPVCVRVCVHVWCDKCGDVHDGATYSV
jgi:hypothetical protein